MKKMFKLVCVFWVSMFLLGLFSCGGSDDVEEYVPMDWECVFWFEGKEYNPGDTLYLKEFDVYKISWKDVNPENNGHPLVKPQITGLVEPSIILNSSITFQCVNTGVGTCSVYDDETGQKFVLHLIIEKMDLDDLKRNVRLGTRDYNFTFSNGCHGVTVETRENVGTLGRIDIKSFGVDEHVFYPSDKDSKWATWRSSIVNWTGTNFYDLYQGTTSKADIGNVNYCFCTFVYRDTKHEIRYYYQIDEFMWDGEWEE